MAFFNTVSIGSTTGFATTDYSRWPVFAPMLMIMLSSVRPARAPPARASRWSARSSS